MSHSEPVGVFTDCPDLSAEEVDAINARHCPSAPADYPSLLLLQCDACGQPWPCETRRLVATLTLMREDRDSARGWATQCETERDDAFVRRERAEELCMRYGIDGELP